MPNRQRDKQRRKSVKTRRDIGLGAAFRSFFGHLEGTGKAKHTLASYRFDLRSFEEYLRSERHTGSLANVKLISRRDLERFHDWLKMDGQKTNTRRRKLMTVRKFMQYLASRKKLDSDLGKKLPAPEKIERVPLTLDAAAFRKALLAFPGESHLGLRNSALLLVLLETGASVSEAAGLRWSMVDLDASKIRFLGKSERDLEISPELTARLAKLRGYAADSDDLCFVGFNRYGPVRLGKKSMAITPRGVEMLVKAMSGDLGFPQITPRTLRHSAVVAWFKAGVVESEIQKRLGLKTAYTFRIYQPIFASLREAERAESKSSSASTSTS